ncbi:[NiFe] hydrogenase metallocenter assembly protein HypE [hydrothermal vent metagenome]|uniref:[NiFe] hydrogenase metallocenter assembly protein HypE n=1 Tax=hydrothermal vent metagenome TaxID=652676 RepID=A0A3B0S7I3_9ZZZZ
MIRKNRKLSAGNAKPGDIVIVNGLLGDHGAAILAARGDMALDVPVESDCASLNGLIETLLDVCPEISFIRDATRGGIATVLNEIAEASGVSIEIEEDKTPLRRQVKGFCEILGLDPLYLANEGKIVIVVPAGKSQLVLNTLLAHPLGLASSAVGKVGDWDAGRVTMLTSFGGRRIVDMLVGEQLPRIC